MRIASSEVHMTSVSVRETRIGTSFTRGQILTTESALRRAGLLGNQNAGNQNAGNSVNRNAGNSVNQNAQNAEGQNAQNSVNQNSVNLSDLTEEQLRELAEAGERALTGPEPEPQFRLNSPGLGRIQLRNGFLSEIRNRQLTLLHMLLEAMTGRRFSPITLGQNTGHNMNQNQLQNVQTFENPVLLTFSHFSLEQFESESVKFSATANITTKEGLEINIDMAVNMTRELYQSFNFTNLGMMEFIDPLVINFDAAFAALSDEKMEFDLDVDGRKDQISRLLAGSGFLANISNSSEIQDGSQLFGALCGNGFNHLARYDSDGNNWIDAGDEIWDSLRIWVHNEDGTCSLIGLGELGIGAIFLGNVETDFALIGDNSGEVNGMLRRTGFFLFTDGTAGTVQHLDLRV